MLCGSKMMNQTFLSRDESCSSSCRDVIYHIRNVVGALIERVWFPVGTLIGRVRNIVGALIERVRFPVETLIGRVRNIVSSMI